MSKKEEWAKPQIDRRHPPEYLLAKRHQVKMHSYRIGSREICAKCGGQATRFSHQGLCRKCQTPLNNPHYKEKLTLEVRDK